MSLIRGVTAIGLLAACSCGFQAHVPMFHSRQTSRGTNPSVNQKVAILDGRITFSGEFQFYPKRADVGRRYDRTCISGYLATNRQQIASARVYDGKHVRVVGTLVPVAQYWSPTELGSPVESYCDSVDILIARSISVLP